MIRRFVYVLVLTGCFYACGMTGSLQAASSQDGFVEGKALKGKYFSLLLEDGVDIPQLTMRLSIPPGLQAVIRQPHADISGNDLAVQFDLLFLAISEIMDIRIKTFKIEVKICKDAQSLTRVTERLFGKPIQTGGFYVVVLDTLYIDAQNVDLNILGHEMSHAIQTHYFVVPPPEKIQEVLAGFVEYELRKYAPQKQR